MKWKRPLAILGLVIIAASYICTIIFALSGSPYATNMLMAALFCTIVIPVIMYAYMMIYKAGRDRLEKDVTDTPDKIDENSR